MNTEQTLALAVESDSAALSSLTATETNGPLTPRTQNHTTAHLNRASKKTPCFSRRFKLSQIQLIVAGVTSTRNNSLFF